MGCFCSSDLGAEAENKDSSIGSNVPMTHQPISQKTLHQQNTYQSRDVAVSQPVIHDSQPPPQRNPPSQKSPGGEIDIPDFLIHFFRCHLDKLRQQFTSLEIQERKDGTKYLQVTDEGKGRHDVFRMLSEMCAAQIQVEEAQCSHLDSSEKKRIEQSHKCVVMTHTPSILLTATSPWGHRVYMCEGSIDHHDCQMLVLPLHEGQRAWPPMICQLLQKERLMSDTSVYSEDVGPPPKEGIRIYRCPKDERRQVALIHIPAHISDKELTDFRISLTHFIRTSGEVNSIAVPITMISENVQNRKEPLRVIMDNIVNDKVPVCSLKLFLDEGHADNARLLEVMNKLLVSNKWKSSGTCEIANEPIIAVIAGDITNMKADVLVNSAHLKLDLNHGKLSQVLQTVAGPELSKQCKQRYPEGLKDCVVAFTDSFNLKAFRKIFHIYLPHWTRKNEAEAKHIMHNRLEWLRTCTKACLTLASAMNYKSIRFPTLGTGTLGYPARQVAETMFNAFREFFYEMPQSSLRSVRLVCYNQDADGFQSFKLVENRFALQQNAESTSDFVLKAGTVQIQIIQGNHQQCTCPADFVIVGNQAGAGHARNEEPVDEDDLGKEMRRIVAFTEENKKFPFCMYILLETFSCKHHHIVAAVEECLSAAKNLKIVALVVPSSEDLHRVFKAFKSVEVVHTPGAGRDSTASNGGGLKSLTICGTLSSVENATKEILDLPVHVDPPVDGPQQWQKGDHQGKRKHKIEKNYEENGLNLGSEWHTGGRRQLQGQVAEEATGFKGSKGSAWSKVVDVLELEALQCLLRENFKDNFISEKTDQDKVLIRANMANPPEELVTKINGIRREDIEIEGQLNAETFDLESEGMEAYFKALPQQGRVAVLCFDYNTMTKAKHFLSVKTGKIRTTSRGKRKFDRKESGETEISQTGHAWQQQALSLELTTHRGRIRVSVYKTDITKLPVDVIVNAANEQLFHGGGVAGAIARAAGFALESEGDAFIQQHGKLKVTQVVATTAGNLPCRKVLHAVGPRWADYQDKSLCCQALVKTVFNCLTLASDSGFTSVAISSISSAIFGVPQKICSECYLSAVQRYDSKCGHKTSLTQIHFVDVNDTMVTIIQDTFRSSWDNPVHFEHLGSHVPPSARDHTVSEPARRHQQELQKALRPAPSSSQQTWSSQKMESAPPSSQQTWSCQKMESAPPSSQQTWSGQKMESAPPSSQQTWSGQKMESAPPSSQQTWSGQKMESAPPSSQQTLGGQKMESAPPSSQQTWGGLKMESAPLSLQQTSAPPSFQQTWGGQKMESAPSSLQQTWVGQKMESAPSSSQQISGGQKIEPAPPSSQQTSGGLKMESAPSSSQQTSGGPKMESAAPSSQQTSGGQKMESAPPSSRQTSV